MSEIRLFFGFRLPAKVDGRGKRVESLGKLTAVFRGRNGKNLVATGAQSQAQQVDTERDSSPSSLESFEANAWLKSAPGQLVLRRLTWLAMNTYPALIPGQISECPESWIESALEIRSVCFEEPDSFELAYLVWSLVTPEGSTIHGI